MGTNPSNCKGNDNRPVEKVLWNDTQEFCRKLSAKESIAYRLPTEAEWEYACRAGSMTKYCFGNDERRLGRYAWYEDNTMPRVMFGIALGAAGTHPVAQKMPNAWGLYDMHGNVEEWCQDVWHRTYDGAPTDGSAWLTDGDSKSHVFRGGSFLSRSRSVRCAYRSGIDPAFRLSYVGFRVVSPLALGSDSSGSEQAKE